MGSTLGLFLANAPVVFLGDKLVARLPMTLVRRIAAVFFLILGILSFLGW